MKKYISVHKNYTKLYVFNYQDIKLSGKLN